METRLKTAEEWELEIYKADVRQNPVKIVRAIQLDAYRAGMERAAKICAGRHPLATSPLALSCIIADAAQTAQLP